LSRNKPETRKRAKKSIKVAFQGVIGAYSEQAALNFFKNETLELNPRKEFEDVFSAVKRKSVDYGIVPLENSLTGSIHQNYDLLLKNNIWVSGEIKLRISHNLLCKKSTKKQDIRNVYSHPQALMQCQGYFKSNNSLINTPYYDTAGSAAFVAESDDKTIAAIASKNAAKEYGLKIVASKIEDNEMNFTRFIVLENKPKPVSKTSGKTIVKTSILFSLKNIPGALYKALSIFAIRDIDLFKIESRPIPGSPWKYLFYLDFAGSFDDSHCQKAVEHLKEISELVKVLGSFPADLSKS